MYVRIELVGDFLYYSILLLKCGDSVKGNGVQDGFVELGCLDFGTGKAIDNEVCCSYTLC